MIPLWVLTVLHQVSAASAVVVLGVLLRSYLSSGSHQPQEHPEGTCGTPGD